VGPALASDTYESDPVFGDRGAAKPAERIPAGRAATAVVAALVFATDGPTRAPAMCRNVRRSEWLLFGSDVGVVLLSQLHHCDVGGDGDDGFNTK
jgi:hypothetical protein